MLRMSRKRTFSILFAVAVVSSVLGCGARRATADRAEVFADDVPRFYAALDNAGPAADPATLGAALEREYIAVGSPGLVSFMDSRIGTAQELAKMVARRRAYYEAIRPALLAMASDPQVEVRVREAFARLNAWLPDARFPDAYLVVGRMNSAGTASDAGLLIGLEMFGRGPNVPTHELDRWASMTIRDADDLVFTIVHESIHPLQEGGKPRTLLEAAVHEGACDFLAAMATGTVRRTPTYEYARAHTGALWAEFTTAMHGTDCEDWLYASPRDAARPPDLAYALGAFICEAYWERTSDKQAAARTLLRCRLAGEMLTASGYAPK